jgi:DNA methylase
MQVLDQQRLDVVSKTRSNIFGWRGQFTPELVEYLLDETDTGAGIVVDPFCGSGTVLRECAARGRPVHGFEINPAAYGMSRFFTLCRLGRAERLELMTGVERSLRSVSAEFGDLPLFNPTDDYRGRASNLLDLARQVFAKAESRHQTLILLLILFEAEGCRFPGLTQAVFTAAARIKRHLLQLPYTTTSVEASLCDARLTHRYVRGEATLVLTSPPYINVFNYHQNHRALLELMGFDLLHVAASEIGSNRKNRQNRCRTIVQYALDMEQCLESFALSLAVGGKLILVVGRESAVRGLSIPNSHLVGLIADGLKAFEHENTFERSFTNRFGASIYEDILVLRRLKTQPTAGGARASAIALLEELSSSARGDVLADVQAAIADVPSIKPSPVFTRKAQI